MDDQVPRVVSHASAAITNVIECMNPNGLRPYLKTILEKNLI